jgi:DNA (cytosine-5)-methyltransferase 1
MMKKRLPYIVSLFSGAGGLDVGFKEAGFNIRIAMDVSEAAIRTHRRNNLGHKAFAIDFTKVGVSGILARIRRAIPKGSTIGIIGGPPCQGFSRSNPNSTPSDPRNALAQLYVQVVRRLSLEYKVSFALFENVIGIRDQKHKFAFRQILNGFRNNAMRVHHLELSAIDFGVPQKRNRVFIAAISREIRFKRIAFSSEFPLVTVGNAIRDLPEPTFFKRGLKECDIGFHPNHWAMQPRSHRFTTQGFSATSGRSFRRLDWDKPSPTVAYGHREMSVHPTGKRRLSILEAMRLQSFSDSFVIEGNFSQQVEQISNAVPPKMAKGIADVIRDIVLRSPA